MQHGVTDGLRRAAGGARLVGWLTTLALVAAGCSGTAAAWSRVPHVEAVLGGPGPQLMLDVAAGGPGLVAVGGDRSDDLDAAVWTSVDGREWSRAAAEALAGPSDQVMRSVTAGGPGLVAVGDESIDSNTDAAVWTSPDGIGWSRVSSEAFGGERNQIMWGVTAGGPGLVAVGAEGFDAAVWHSSDGITWVRVPHDEANLGSEGRVVMRSVTVGGPGLVAVGAEEIGADSRAAIWTSGDGLSWSRVPNDESAFGGDGFQAMFAVTAGGPGVVAVGGEQAAEGSNAAVWVSADGLVWSRIPHEAAAFGGDGSPVMFGVAATGDGVVAVGADPQPAEGAETVWTSQDGVTWSRVAVEGSVPDPRAGLVMFAVAARAGGWVAVGQEVTDGDSNAAVWETAG